MSKRALRRLIGGVFAVMFLFALALPSLPPQASFVLAIVVLTTFCIMIARASPQRRGSTHRADSPGPRRPQYLYNGFDSDSAATYPSGRSCQRNLRNTPTTTANAITMTEAQAHVAHVRPASFLATIQTFFSGLFYRARDQGRRFFHFINSAIRSSVEPYQTETDKAAFTMSAGTGPVDVIMNKAAAAFAHLASAAQMSSLRGTA